jgi:TolB-like protein
MDIYNKPQKTIKSTPRVGKDPALANPLAQVYRFNCFLLDPAERILLRDTTRVALPPKAFDLLSVLVESAGHLVTKTALVERVWPDAFVEEANLSVNIAILRKSLGQGAGRHYIETVRKLGYRFVARVLEVDSETALKVLTHEQESASLFPQKSKLTSSHELNSLAVLPFENESGDPGAEYLSDGLTESIINSLSDLEAFRVLARNAVFRYKAKSVDPQKIGEELGVRLVLTGRILQLGDQLIIRTEVMDVQGGWQIWGEQYHRNLSDMLAVQEEIAEEISAKLRLKLTVDQKETT